MSIKMEHDEIAALLNSRKLKSTKIRHDVLAIVKSSKQAVPQSAIQTRLGNFDRVTLYRTLNVLEEKGILHKAFTENNETYFAVCTSNCSTEEHQHKHIHFKCESCFSVKCVKPEIPVKISLPNFEVRTINIEVSGICDSCLMN